VLLHHREDGGLYTNWELATVGFLGFGIPSLDFPNSEFEKLSLPDPSGYVIIRGYMAEKILRILNDNGSIEPGAELPELSDSDLVRLYRAMLFNRRFDERMIRLQRQGRIGFYVGSVGEEAAIVGSAFALQPQDWVVPCYREAGAAFLRGYPMFEYVCQLFGNSRDPIKGRQMPCHWASSELHLASVSSPIATQIPHAVGLAMAAQTLGKPEVAVAYFGDGATSHGDFHVSCNFAAVFKAPVIFLCRNNQYAISVPVSQQTVSESMVIKAVAYGMEGILVDGNDALAVYTATKAAAEKARRGEGPTLIEALTYRQGAHTTSDDPRAYRSDDEVEAWKAKDPLLRLRLYLEAGGLWSESQETQFEEAFRDEIHELVEKAEVLGPPPVSTIFDDVFDRVPWHLERQRAELLEILGEGEQRGEACRS